MSLWILLYVGIAILAIIAVWEFLSKRRKARNKSLKPDRLTIPDVKRIQQEGLGYIEITLDECKEKIESLLTQGETEPARKLYRRYREELSSADGRVLKDWYLKTKFEKPKTKKQK